MSVKSAQYADRFKSVFEQAAEAAVGDKQKLQQDVAALNEKRIEIDQQIEALEKQLAEIDDDILVGLKHAAKEAGVRLELGNGQTKEPAKQSAVQVRLEVHPGDAVAWTRLWRWLLSPSKDKNQRPPPKE